MTIVPLHLFPLLSTTLDPSLNERVTGHMRQRVAQLPREGGASHWLMDTATQLHVHVHVYAQ